MGHHGFPYRATRKPVVRARIQISNPMKVRNNNGSLTGMSLKKRFRVSFKRSNTKNNRPDHCIFSLTIMPNCQSKKKPEYERLNINTVTVPNLLAPSNNPRITPNKARIFIIHKLGDQLVTLRRAATTPTRKTTSNPAGQSHQRFFISICI